MARQEKTIAINKKARHDYFIEETFEAGIVLTGTEVKSLRENGANLRDTFATVKKDEVWLNGVHIAPYSHGNRANTGRRTGRASCCCTRRRSATSWARPRSAGTRSYRCGSTSTRTTTLKVELALATGKKLFDKRHAIAERDSKRDVERTLGQRIKGM